MKKFRFPLRSVETVRGMREMRAREAFTAALHAYAEAEAVLAQAREQRRRLEDVIVMSRGARLRPADQVAFQDAYREELAREARAAQASTTAKTRLEERREAWIVTRRDLRVIENLEAKARQTYRREVEYEEQKLLDDRTNATAGRAPLLTP
jgi:flagellar protein FliJ